MLRLFFTICFFCSIYMLIGQDDRMLRPDSIIVTYNNGRINGKISPSGGLSINLPSHFLKKAKTTGFVNYSSFGAKGDGKTDDIKAIALTHAFANQHQLKVKAESKATYFIGQRDIIVIIQTDTDFGTANFIIDDTQVDNLKSPIFRVTSDLEPFKVTDVKLLKQNQEEVNVKLPRTCLVTVTNDKINHYIRYGLNQNNGDSQTDVFLIDKEGKVDMQAPIIWDFDHISEMVAQPIDQKTLKITGGLFTTIANQDKRTNYYSRNILINRSNVLIEGLTHKIIDEGEHGAPYSGFISITNCAFVTVRNTILTGHKMYKKIGSAGKPVPMGSYDILASTALNISFINCTQTNDINDATYWGIFASNYCKNILYDSCILSRFDAHKGVANATIRNSTLGYMGINAIGSGIFKVENSTILSSSLINLRSDYGSTWQGELMFRNCIFKPRGTNYSKVSLINGSYSGLHNFGYKCYLPEKISIENLSIEDTNYSPYYDGPYIFFNFNKEITDTTFQQDYPYIISTKVILTNVSTTSGRTLNVSENIHMFKDVEIIRK